MSSRHPTARVDTEFNYSLDKANEIKPWPAGCLPSPS